MAMTRDWIKMRTDLYRDPKVSMIADSLMETDGELSRYVSRYCNGDMSVTRNVMRNAVVGALVSVWGVLRRRGKRLGDDLVVKACSQSTVDDIADLPGFGDAMICSGWMVDTEVDIILPRFFEEFNVDPADEQRSKNAERQKRHREKARENSNVTRNVTVTPKCSAREEKRREDIDTPNGVSITDAAERVYSIYPKKVGKGTAIKAIKAALGKVTEEILTEAVTAYAAACKGQDQQFVPHPATWFNQERWNDDRSNWNGKPQGNFGKQDSPSRVRESGPSQYDGLV